MGKRHSVLKLKSPRFSAPMPVSAGESASTAVPDDDMTLNRCGDMSRVGWGSHFSRFFLRKISYLDEMIESSFENRLKIALRMFMLEQITCFLKFLVKVG